MQSVYRPVKANFRLSKIQRRLKIVEQVSRTVTLMLFTLRAPLFASALIVASDPLEKNVNCARTVGAFQTSTDCRGVPDNQEGSELRTTVKNVGHSTRGQLLVVDNIRLIYPTKTLCASVSLLFSA